jgi:hypothetical protein
MSSREASAERQIRVVEGLFDIAGTAAGAWTGTVLNSAPMLAGAASVAITTLILLAKSTSSDILRRQLSDTEGQRIAQTVESAAEAIKVRLANGRQPRADWFSDAPHGRNAAAEIFEGVLISAQREHEERKLRFFGNLLANLAFDPTVDRATANLLLRLGKSLSYRQLGLLSVFHDTSRWHLRQDDYRPREDGQIPNMSLSGSLALEIFELNTLGVIENGEGTFIMDFVDIRPGHMALKVLGLLLHKHMQLEEFDVAHLHDEIQELTQ